MFGRLFKSARELPSKDLVWVDDDARDAGLRTALATAVRERSVLLVVRGHRELERIVEILEPLRPIAATEGFALDDTFSRLAAYGSVVVTTAGSLERTPTTAPASPPEIHVMARSPHRSTDARLLASLQRWHQGPVTFHSSLKDPLLRERVAGIGPMLESLGLHAGEPLGGTAISRALRKAQRD